MYPPQEFWSTVSIISYTSNSCRQIWAPTSRLSSRWVYEETSLRNEKGTMFIDVIVRPVCKDKCSSSVTCRMRNKGGLWDYCITYKHRPRAHGLFWFCKGLMTVGNDSENQSTQRNWECSMADNIRSIGLKALVSSQHTSNLFSDLSRTNITPYSNSVNMKRVFNQFEPMSRYPSFVWWSKVWQTQRSERAYTTIGGVCLGWKHGVPVEEQQITLTGPLSCEDQSFGLSVAVICSHKILLAQSLANIIYGLSSGFSAVLLYIELKIWMRKISLHTTQWKISVHGDRSEHGIMSTACQTLSSFWEHAPFFR